MFKKNISEFHLNKLQVEANLIVSNIIYARWIFFRIRPSFNEAKAGTNSITKTFMNMNIIFNETENAKTGSRIFNQWMTFSFNVCVGSDSICIIWFTPKTKNKLFISFWIYSMISFFGFIYTVTYGAEPRRQDACLIFV